MAGFKEAKEKITKRVKSVSDLPNKLHAKMSKLLDELARISNEIEETRKRLENEPGSMWYVHAHPEKCPEEYFIEKATEKYL